MRKDRETTYQEAYGVVQDYEDSEHISYDKYSRTMDILLHKHGKIN